MHIPRTAGSPCLHVRYLLVIILSVPFKSSFIPTIHKNQSIKNIKLKEKASIIFKAQNIETGFTTKISALACKLLFQFFLHLVEYSRLISTTVCKRV